MGADGTDRERTLEQRVERLEARLGSLERELALEQDHPLRMAEDAPSATYAVPSIGLPTIPPEVALPTPTAWLSVSIPVPAAVPSGWVRPDTGDTARVASYSDITPDAAALPYADARPALSASSFRFPIDLSGSLNDIEERLAGRALAWAGGAAILLGAIFFLSLAFSRGWIGPEARVLLGLVTGIACLGGGAAFLDRGNRLLGLVLTPIGLAIISISLVAATRLYGLIPVELGLGLALASAIAAAVIAVRANSQVVAAFGLIAVLVAPPLLGAAPDAQTLVFVAVVLVGTTGIALWRTWSWLPPVAFVLSAPQAAWWVSSDPEPALGLIGIGLFWLLNTVAAGGESVRRRRDDLSPSSASLLLANAAFLIWAGFELLDGNLVVYRGVLLVLVALAHLAIGGAIVLRDGDRNLFGLLVIGTGIASLTMAAPISLGAPAVPVAWSAEAVALTWLAVRRHHPYSALAAGLLFLLAGGALVRHFARITPQTSGMAFGVSDGASLAFFGFAIAAGVWLIRDRSIRSALSTFGLVVVAVSLTQVLAPPAAVIALTGLTVLGLAVWRGLPLMPHGPIGWQVDGLIPQFMQPADDWRRPADLTLPAVTALLAGAATIVLTAEVYGRAVAGSVSGIPFANDGTTALAVYLLGLVAIAWLSGRSWFREPLAAVGLLVVARACAAEFAGINLVAAWASLMAIGFALWRGLAALRHEPPPAFLPLCRRMWGSDVVLPGAALVAGGLAAIHVALVELPITWFGPVVPPTIPFTDAGAAAGLILIVSVLATGALVATQIARRTAVLAAIGVIAYTVPFEVYAWAVSVLWVALACIALVLVRADLAGRRAYVVVAASLVIGAAVVAILIVAPPARLVVGWTAISAMAILQTVAALSAVTIGLVALAQRQELRTWARWASAAAGVSLVYLLSVATVDLFAAQIGGRVPVDELRTQGQVALSVVWAVLGLVAFAAGLRLRIDDLRHGGLALLGLATAKVFLFDLSALDVAYRVISLVALGLLLLIGAWVWQRLEPRSARLG